MSQRILLVDDDPDALQLLSLILSRRGFQTLKASGGPQALGMLANELPDMVILDVMMPQMDGYEVCRHIKSDPRTAHLLVMMLSAKADSVGQVEGFRSGADDYMTKPVHPDDLVARIRSMLDQPQSAPRESGGRLISVLSTRGGVGATTLAVNLAATLAGSSRVILADLDPSGMAALHLGIESGPGVGSLVGLPLDGITPGAVEAALTAHSNGLRMLVGSEQPLDAARAGLLVPPLLSLCDVCVADLGVGLNPVARALAPRSNELLLVLDVDRVTLVQANRTMQGLAEAGLAPQALKLIWVNRMGTPLDLGQVAVQSALARKPDAVIPPSAEAIYQALEKNSPLVTCMPDHPASIQVRDLAASLKLQ